MSTKRHEHGCYDISKAAGGRRLQACSEHGCIATRIVE